MTSEVAACLRDQVLISVYIVITPSRAFTHVS